MSAKELAQKVGVRFDGAQETMRKERILLFTEPTTQSTFGIWESDLSLESVQAGRERILSAYSK